MTVNPHKFRKSANKAPRIIAVTATDDVVRLHRLADRGVPVLLKPLSADLLALLAPATGDKTSDPLNHYTVTLRLSGRETQILRATIEGHSEQQIANDTGLAVGTIRSFWQRIFRKTGCHSKAEVAAAVARLTIRGPKAG